MTDEEYVDWVEEIKDSPSCSGGVGDGGASIFVGFFVGVPLILLAIFIVSKIFGL